MTQSEIKLADFLVYFKKKTDMSVRQLAHIVGYGDIVVTTILSTGKISAKQHRRIYTNLTAFMDEMHIKYTQIGMK